MKKLVFITGNEAKAKYLTDYFNWPVDHQKLDLHEIQSLDLEEVVKEKAKAAYKIIKKPVLVEDVSLVFKELKKLPGPLIGWFLDTLGNEGLIKLIKKDRTAYAKVAFCYCDGKTTRIFTGAREGTISKSAKGEMGFGWDPIFIPKGYNKTWAQMTDDEKHSTSMRKIALAKLKNYLDNGE